MPPRVDARGRRTVRTPSARHWGDRYWENLRKCKRRRREAAIAEGKKPLPNKGSEGERRKLPSGVWGVVPETDTIFTILC